jgi:hypothetical protein
MRTAKIFISYGSQDRDMATLLADELGRKGFDVWLDVAEISAGVSIVTAISEEMAKTDIILVLLSRDSVASPWCRAEYEAALTQEIETGAKRVIPVILDDVAVPPLLASRRRIDLRKGRNSLELRWIEHTLNDALKELPIAAMLPDRPRYRYSKLAMIMSGVLDELPVPSFDQEPLLHGRTLVDLYRTVERLIERFEEVCRSLATVLGEAGAGPMSYFSVNNLRSAGIVETNTRLIRIANDMREIAKELSQIVASDGTLYRKLTTVSALCTAISLNEDVLVIVLSKPKTLPMHLLEARSRPGHFYDLLDQLDGFYDRLDQLDELTKDTEAFDSSSSPWGEPSDEEVSDLERIVVDMERYRAALRTAVAHITAPT